MNEKEIIKDFEQSNFWNFMNFELIELKQGFVSTQLQVKEEFENVQGILHGGALMSLIDTTMGMTAKSIGGKKVSTIQLEVRFVKSVTAGFVVANAKVIHELKSTCIIECDVVDSNGGLVAVSTSTFKK